MKKKRGTLYLVVAAIILVGVFSNVTTVDAKTKNGFTYDKKEFDVKWVDYEKIVVKSDEGGTLGTLSYLTGVARAKGTNDYLILFKEVMTPGTKKVKLNIYNQKGYGMSEYMSLKATLASLSDYKPQNDPNTDSINIGMGIDKDGPSVSASYEVKTSELDITSKCNTPKNLYQVVYDYKPHIPNVFGSNKYLANESVQMGMAEITKKKGKVNFTVDYEARFGAASKKNCRPETVWLDYVKNKKGSRKYKFDFNK